MGKVELTPAKLADIKKKAEAAENCSPSPWVYREMPSVKGEVRDSENFQVAGWFILGWQAEHIAAADPATVLAMVEEIETLRAGLKASCPHWQQDGDGINEWRRCCTNSSYTIPAGGEPSEFCPDCGGKVEVLDYDPNAESEVGQ